MKRIDAYRKLMIEILEMFGNDNGVGIEFPTISIHCRTVRLDQAVDIYDFLSRELEDHSKDRMLQEANYMDSFTYEDVRKPEHKPFPWVVYIYSQKLKAKIGLGIERHRIKQKRKHKNRE